MGLCGCRNGLLCKMFIGSSCSRRWDRPDKQVGTMAEIRALAFDIQGTAVDFFAPMMRMGAEVNARKALSIDWEAFSAAWRGLYREGMDRRHRWSAELG